MPKLKELGKLQGITISFTESQYDDLIALSKRMDRPIAYLVREAVDSFLEEHRTQPTAADIVSSLKAQPLTA